VIGQTIIQTGQWEGLLSRTILACLKPGDLALDVGANMGYDSMLMSKGVGASGRVLAFEPDLGNIELLLRNLALLDHRNVAVQSLALSDAAGMAEIAVSGEGNRGQSNLRPEGGDRVQAVLVARLDDLLSSTIDRRIALVKIDVEGYEQRVIDGMGRLLDRVDVLTCEVDPKYLKACGSDATKLFDTLWRAGFSSYCAQPNSNGLWRPSGPDFHIEVAHSQHFDALFCRRLGNPELATLVDNH
jgi:FkbM family methyltransferase